MIAASNNPDPAASRHRILVVEDEVLIRMDIADALRDVGYTVVESASADEAMRVIGTSLAIDLVVTDVNMPGRMDGLALARWVKEQSPSTRVVVLSGQRFAADQKVIDAAFAKPVQPGALMEQIRRLLIEKA